MRWREGARIIVEKHEHKRAHACPRCVSCRLHPKAFTTQLVDCLLQLRPGVLALRDRRRQVLQQLHVSLRVRGLRFHEASDELAIAVALGLAMAVPLVAHNAVVLVGTAEDVQLGGHPASARGGRARVLLHRGRLGRGRADGAEAALAVGCAARVLEGHGLGRRARGLEQGLCRCDGASEGPGVGAGALAATIALLHLARGEHCRRLSRPFDRSHKIVDICLHVILDARPISILVPKNCNDGQAVTFDKFDIKRLCGDICDACHRLA
mmetsp:Transcript_23281/g.75290  ORF Transcript_23281/g.75290 Transcript_23281/m.75290 type:complete len:267 (+) Transcript_23281:176-976(+)